MSAQSTWTLGTEDGDRVIRAMVESGNRLLVAVDGREVVRTKAVNGNYGFLIGGHHVSLAFTKGMSCWLRLVILWIGFYVVLTAATLCVGLALGSTTKSSSDGLSGIAGLLTLVVLYFFDRIFLANRARFQLSANGRVVPPGGRVVLAERVSQPAQRPAPPPQPVAAPQQPQAAPAALVPDVPPRCEMCGSALSMDNLRWTGPMSAACKYCNAPVPIQWKKIGG